MRKVLSKLLLCFLLTAASAGFQTLHAQGDPGGGGTVGVDPDTPLPIDGGLSLLLAAGVGYGIKKGRDAMKRKKEEQASDTPGLY